MNKNRKSIAIVSVCSFFWAMFILFGNMEYEGNDDVLMNLLSAGALGNNTPFLVYNDYWFGLLIDALYHIFPYVNCYLWFYLVLNFISISVLCFIFSNKLSATRAVIVTIAINCLLSYDFYNYIQYTKNAMLYSITGMIVLLWMMFELRALNWLFTIGGSFLIMLGFGIRHEAFLLSVPYAFGILLILIVFDFIKEQKIKRSMIAIIIILPGLLCMLSSATDYIFCKSNSNWSEYYKIDSILIEMRDFYQHKYVDAPDEYLAAGITETDFEMIGNWVWNDPEQFTLSKLQKLSEIGDRFRTDKVHFYKEMIWKVGNKIGDSMMNKGIAILFLVLFLLSMTMDTKTRIINCYLFSILALELFYIVCRGRFVWRAEVCVWLPAILLSSYYGLLFIKNRYSFEGNYNSEDNKGNVDNYRTFINKALVCLQILIILGCVFSWRFFQFYNNGYQNTNEDTEGYELVQKINASDAFFVVHVVNMGRLLGAKNIFEIDCRYKGCYSNSTFLGSWLIPSPIARDSYQKHGIDNPIKNLVDDNVFCIASEGIIDLLKRFLEEKYGYNVKVSQETIDGISAWKFSSYN